MDVEFPECFGTNQEYEAWVSHAEEDCIDDNPRLSFCQFCTRNYQQTMTLLGRCQYPNTRVYEEEEVTEDDFGYKQLSF